MKRIAIGKRPTKEQLFAAVDTLRTGGIVVYPTDTVYGLAVDACNVEAIGKVFILKKRSQKPLPVIVPSIVEAKKIAEISPQQEKILKKYWPGAVTFVLKKKPNVPNALTLGLETIGIRIPHSTVPVILSRMLGSPITSTSANISGDNIGTTIDEVIRQFQTSEFMPDCFLDAGELSTSEPSTIVDLTTPKPKVIRKGPVIFS